MLTKHAQELYNKECCLNSETDLRFKLQKCVRSEGNEHVVESQLSNQNVHQLF